MPKNKTTATPKRNAAKITTQNNTSPSRINPRSLANLKPGQSPGRPPSGLTSTSDRVLTTKEIATWWHTFPTPRARGEFLEKIFELGLHLTHKP